MSDSYTNFQTDLTILQIYRSYMARVHPGDPVMFWLYYPVFFRLLSIFTAIKLLKYLERLPRSSGFGPLFDNFKYVYCNMVYFELPLIQLPEIWTPCNNLTI